MEKLLWNKCQQFIEAGQMDLAIPMLIKELQDNLTEEQFDRLGDIRRILIDTFSNKQIYTAEQLMKKIIEMTQNGYILGPKDKK